MTTLLVSMLMATLLMTLCILVAKIRGSKKWKRLYNPHNPSTKIPLWIYFCNYYVIGILLIWFLCFLSWVSTP